MKNKCSLNILTLKAQKPDLCDKAKTFIAIPTGAMTIGSRISPDFVIIEDRVSDFNIVFDYYNL